METKLVRIAEISATSKHPIFTSMYHLINEDMLKQCHKKLDECKINRTLSLLWCYMKFSEDNDIST